MQDLPRLHLGLLSPDVEPAMTPGQAHYLGGVLRRAPGDRVRLFNQADGEWTAEILTLRKGRGSFRLLRRLREPTLEPGPDLLFAPLKRDPTDLVVRMATELGAACLRPVMTERTNTARINAERWQAIAVEAAEQCERLSIPAIAAPAPLPALLAGWDRARPLLAALERAAEPDTRIGPAAWRTATPAWLQPGLLIGPEGGFSPNETRLLGRYDFVIPIRLGPLILRAETACVAGLAALHD